MYKLLFAVLIVIAAACYPFAMLLRVFTDKKLISFPRWNPINFC